MSMLSDADLDRLADYTAGVLSGRDEAEVAELVRADPHWAAAYAALGPADAAVRLDLQTAAGPISMPDDVVARVDRALAAAAADPRSGGTGSAAPTRAAVIPIDSRRRQTRRLGLRITAAAAAVIAVVGGGAVAINVLQGGTLTSAPNAARADSAGGAAEGSAPGAPSRPAGRPATIASGRDYQPDTLGGLAQSADQRADGALPPPALSSKAASGLDTPSDATAPAPLSRLADPVALDACLAAIGVTHPGVVRLVDYAMFNHQPAVLVLIQQGATSIVVVAGTDCGVAGADERTSAVVG